MSFVSVRRGASRALVCAVVFSALVSSGSAQDLTTSTTLATDLLYMGDNSTVAVVVTEDDGAAAGAFTVTVTFPSVLNIDLDDSSALPAPSDSPAGGTITKVSATSVTWALTGLAGNASATLTVPFVVDTQLDGDFNITVTHNLADADAGNDDSSDTLSIGAAFKFPSGSQANSVVFRTLESGLERMIVGMYLGAPGINGAVWCRAPDRDGDVLNVPAGIKVYRTCATGLPAVSGTFLPLHVNDLWLDETGTGAGRIYMTTWGSDGLYYSEDDGESWTALEPDLGDGYSGDSKWVNVYSITEDVTDGILFISANNGLIFRSLNNGTSWQQVSSLPEGAAETPWSLISHPSISGTLFAGTFGNGVFVSTDYGLSWAETTDNADLRTASAGHIFDLELVESGANDYLFAATSRGVWRQDYAAGTPGWEELDTDQNMLTPTGVAPEIRSIEFDAGGDLFAVAWGFGVFSHADPTAATPTAGDLTAFALRGMEVTLFAISPSGTIFAGTSDGAFYEMDAANPLQGSATGVGTPEGLPESFVLDQNFPNPFNPSTEISFSLKEPAEIRVAVFDLLGREIQVLAKGQYAAGHHSINFQAGSLSSGNYLYSLEADGYRVFRAMTVLK